MMRVWENNPAGVCEDAPCCGCCGPQGDGAYDPEERAYEDALDAADDELCEHGRLYEFCAMCHEQDDEDDFEPSPDPDWMND